MKSRIWTQTCTQEECHVTMKVGIRVIPRTPKIASKHQKPEERHGTDCPSQSPGQTNSANTLISDF